MDRNDELRKFVAARGAALSRAAYLLTGDRHAAEDLVQETYVVMVRQWRRGCWSPDERSVCWVGRQTVASTKWQVGWVDLASGSGTWTVQELGSAEWARFLGWRGTDPVVGLMDPGRVTVTVATPGGLEVLRTFTFGTVVNPSVNNPPDPFVTVATTWDPSSTVPGTSEPINSSQGGAR